MNDMTLYKSTPPLKKEVKEIKIAKLKLIP